MSTIKYTSKILKATALLDDTKVLFSCWDDGLSVKQNLQKAKEENIFGKSSRSRVKDILNIFRQRYLLNSDLAEALSVLVKQGFLSESLNLIFYFYSARADSLIFDTVADYLTWPEDGRWEIINGIPYNMSPSPTSIHQKILLALASRLYNYFEGKTCEVLCSPF